MIPVLSREAVRRFDASTIEAGVPGIVLMENAGRGAAERILAHLGAHRGARIVVVCGTGNNGGDGFIVARHLRGFDVEPRVVLVGDPERVKGDARLAYDAYLAIGGTVELLPSDIDVGDLKDALSSADAAIDALFGTGLDRALSGIAAEVADALTNAAGQRIALDIPSGLDANTGEPLGAAVTADLTLTFAFYKLGLLTPKGRAHTGAVEIVPIGVPAHLPADIKPSAELVALADLSAWISPRGAADHKYSAGHVAIVGGSSGKLGAPLMAAHAAMRAGAGAATIVSWADAAAKLEARVTEVMVARIEADPAASLDNALHAKKAVVLGPGFGLDDGSRAAAEHVLSTYLGPLVLDADGLTLFAGRADAIAAGVQRARVLTPHSGEAARLLGMTSADVDRDRHRAARTLAEKSQSIVVLKGAHSIIADPDGRVLIGPVGSSALGTAGSGDVLSGIIGAMLCALAPLEAAAAGVTLHAEAGARWAAKHTDRGLVATDIADALPEILAEVVRGWRRESPSRAAGTSP